MIATSAKLKKKESKMIDNDYVFMLEIERMKKDIDEINNTKLPAIGKQVSKLEEKVDKVDMRIWAIIILLVGSILLPIFSKMYLGT